MEHRFTFREISPADLDRHCYFMPEEHEFEMHLNALADDAEWLEDVTGVRHDGSHAIVITTEASLETLKERLIPLLQNHWPYLRIEL